PDTVRMRPRLAAYVRRQVVIGIRPEHLRDHVPPNVRTEARMRVRVERTETVGADAYASFVLDAPLLLAEDPREGEEPVDESWPAERVNRWMARLSTPATGPVELAMDPGRLQVFDPRTGRSIDD